MNRNDKTQKAKEVSGRLQELGIAARLDERGRVVLPFASQEESSNISLPPDEMEKLVDQACMIGLRSLADGVLASILIAVYNTHYVYCR